MAFGTPNSAMKGAAHRNSRWTVERPPEFGVGLVAVQQHVVQHAAHGVDVHGSVVAASATVGDLGRCELRSVCVSWICTHAARMSEVLGTCSRTERNAHSVMRAWTT